MQSYDEVICLYFSAMEKNHIMMWVDFLKLPLQLVLSVFFICYLEWDLVGCACAFNLAFVFKFLVIQKMTATVAIKDQSIRESFYLNIGWDTLVGFKSFVSLSTSGLFLSCLEWWVIEALSILSGLISVQAQAASVIINTLATTVYYIILGFSFALSAMIGSELGRGNVKSAKEITIQTSATCYFYLVLVVIPHIIFR